MARKRRRDRDEQSLDSLLDTMANVTGILVVLLAVSHISMGDAMGRLRDQLEERPELTAEALAVAEAEARALRTELAPLVSDRDDLERRRRAGREEAAALRSLNAEARGKIESARSSDPGSLRRAIQRTSGTERELRRALSGNRAELASLEARVQDLESQPLAREARLPDVRAAPRNARQLYVLCRYGRVIYADDRRLFEELNGGIQRALGEPRQQIDLGLLTMPQRVRLMRHFEVSSIGASGLRWVFVSDERGRLAPELRWSRRDLGETESEVTRARSDFRRELQRTSPLRAFLQYLVWDDSFDAYLAARGMSDEMGYAAGWIPLDESEPLRTGRNARLVD